MATSSRVEKVVQSAWMRRLQVVSAERFSIAVAVFLCGLILLLLAGSLIFDWHWVALAGLAGLVLTVLQIRARLLAHYQVAQILDRRLELPDSVSTAWYFLSVPDSHRSPAFAFQLAGAEQLAAGIDVRKAFPWTGGRLWLIAGGLASVALALCIFRYATLDTLNLKRPLIPFFLNETVERAAGNRPNDPRLSPRDETADRRGGKTAKNADGKKDALQPPDLPRQQAPAPDGEATGQNQAQHNDLKGAGNGKESTQEKQSGENNTSDPRPGKTDGEHGDTKGAQKPSTQEDANSPQSGGVLDKMKDAMSSVMEKLRPNSQGQKDSNGSSSQGRKSGQKGETKDQNGNPRQDSASQQEEQQQSAEGQGQTKTQERSGSGQSKNSEQTGSKDNNDRHSGVGSQDGDKALKDAEQLKAMGKLAEIIGKRSEAVTGEMTIETPSGKQHLQTDYSHRVGAHTGLGGEINRDEVPLMYQKYVREYMEQVRKQAK